ncbi:MAG: tRNA (adenosine(37)-N6)-threonylcarbamoyltransferase complex ATPase subunit type 1 TsaE [Chloroflexia bacterium]|nr:tRNA (adenosine(37)-N6)-threonylcarbamoyltransferase complex ATPase subunit type 1 TsaE [Chloroflexia bacterium]
MQIGENILLKTLDEVPEVASKIIENLRLKELKLNTNCLAFYGEMGAGKTTLIKAICKELGVGDTTSSPTFSIINEYVANSRKPIFHFDFYRIDNESEAYDFGYEEYFYSGELCLIEWPEKIESLLPIPHYKLQITVNESGHRIIQMFTEG